MKKQSGACFCSDDSFIALYVLKNNGKAFLMIYNNPDKYKNLMAASLNFVELNFYCNLMLPL